MSALLLGALTISHSTAAVSSHATSTGLPIFSYAQTRNGPLPWDATSRAATMAGTTMAGAPFVTTTSDGTTLTAWRTPTGEVMVNTTASDATSSTLSVLAQLPLAPKAVSDPFVMIDSSGQLRTLYVAAGGRLILTTAWNDTALGALHAQSMSTPTPWTWRDISALTGLSFTGVPGVLDQGNALSLIGRSLDNHAVLMRLPLPWRQAQLGIDLKDVTALAADSGLSADPMWLPGTTTFVAESTTNHIVQYRLSADCLAAPALCSAVTTQDITQATGAPGIASTLSATTTPTGMAIVGLTTSGVATLFKGVGSGGVYTWNDLDISTPSSAPALAENPFIAAVGTTLVVAAKAGNWGDLFVISNATGANTWKSVDVSVTGGSSARTVGGGIDGVVVNGQLTLFAGGVATPAPTGTGLYAIPQNKNSAAVADGWPSIGITGGLGTQSSPWVAVKTTANDIKYSQDFLVGKAIADSHKRTTWLSFWTVSGPMSNEAVTPAVYYAHAFAAGAAVATTIGKYRAQGLGLKPDWVIIDPEGYPDYHSCLDGLNSIATWCPAWSAQNWAGYANGWAAGLASVDPTLNAGIYASQNEYKNGSMSKLTMPVFLAVAFKWYSTYTTASSAAGISTLTIKDSSGLYAGQRLYLRDTAGPEFVQIASGYNGTNLTVPLTAPLKKTHNSQVVVAGISPPLRLSTTVGSNILGYIAFGSSNACLAVPWQIQLFNTAPWSGLYNTLQFDGGIYCRPSGL